MELENVEMDAECGIQVNLISMEGCLCIMVVHAINWWRRRSLWALIVDWAKIQVIKMTKLLQFRYVHCGICLFYYL